MATSPSMDMWARCRYLSNTESTITVPNGSSAEIAAGLPEGLYIVYANVEWHMKQGPTGLSATTSSFRLQPHEKVFMYVSITATDGFVAGYGVSAAGTAHFIKVT